MNKKCLHGRVERTCSVCSPETVYQQYRYSAAQRHLSFTLTEQQFRQLVSGRCHYCRRWAGAVVLGLDRRDNHQSYSLQNCVPACWPCNQMKGHMDNEFQFLAHVRLIADAQEQLRRERQRKLEAQAVKAA
jgi:hypothetical protein